MSSSERPQPSRTPLAGIHHLPPTARILRMVGTATDLIVQEIAFSSCFDYNPVCRGRQYPLCEGSKAFAPY